MAKRFSDTDLWDKEWFMALPAKQKLLIQFLFAKCDQSGVWSPNWMLASLSVGQKVTASDLKPLKNQVEVLANGKLFLPGFIAFQYGELSEKCPPHKKIIALLKSHGLFERVSLGYCYPNSRVQEEDIDKEEETEAEEEEEKGGAAPNVQPPPTPEPPPIILPFHSETFSQAWQSWKDYKKEVHRFQYKGRHSEQAALHQLSKLAKGIESEATELIFYAISRQWTGIYEIPTNDRKNGKPTANNQTNGGGLNASYKAKLAADLAAASGGTAFHGS